MAAVELGLLKHPSNDSRRHAPHSFDPVEGAAAAAAVARYDSNLPACATAAARAAETTSSDSRTSCRSCPGSLPAAELVDLLLVSDCAVVGSTSAATRCVHGFHGLRVPSWPFEHIGGRLLIFCVSRVAAGRRW